MSEDTIVFRSQTYPIPYIMSYSRKVYKPTNWEEYIKSTKEYLKEQNTNGQETRTRDSEIGK